jgi:leucyl/phenylalanyl-tRNA--protein transferase
VQKFLVKVSLLLGSSPEIIASYCELFKQKFAYSVEAYLDNELVGGVYGVCIGELVTGESMFHKSDNASKACLVYLLNILKEKGIPFLDTQMVTPVVKSLGGEEIPRDLFLNFIQSLDLQKSRDWLFH